MYMYNMILKTYSPILSVGLWLIQACCTVLTCSVLPTCDRQKFRIFCDLDRKIKTTKTKVTTIKCLYMALSWFLLANCCCPLWPGPIYGQKKSWGNDKFQSKFQSGTHQGSRASVRRSCYRSSVPFDRPADGSRWSSRPRTSLGCSTHSPRSPVCR